MCACVLVRGCVCLYVRGERGYVSVEDSWLLLWRKEGHLNCLGDTHTPNLLKEINVDLSRGGLLPVPCFSLPSRVRVRVRVDHDATDHLLISVHL